MSLPRLLLTLLFLPLAASVAPGEGSPLDAENLAAWCIVPFDAKKRGPAERAAMLDELGIRRCAYDWRDEHVPTFEEEILAYQKHNIEFFAFWGSHPEAFALFRKYKLHPQIWQMIGGQTGATDDELVASAAKAMEGLAKETADLGCKLALYNHGGWAGEPKNMIAVCERLRAMGYPHVGIVYNFHHGHGHIDDWEASFAAMKPFLHCLNLNGMVAKGDETGKKILALGQGDRELAMLRVVLASGYDGPIGIIDHRPETDSAETLKENLVGLEWLRKELAEPGSGGPRPKPEPAPQARGQLVPGKFGLALNAAAGGLLVVGTDAWRTAPVTVEAWAKLRDAAGFNVVVASDPKASSAHWELYSYAGKGDFAVFLPGRGGEVRSGAPICDDAWHHLAMVLEKERVRLFVDGKVVAEKPLPAAQGAIVPGELALGRTVEPGIGCNGLVDNVHLSAGVREVTGQPEARPRDATTLEQFDFDALPESSAVEPPERGPLDPAAHSLHAHPVNRERLYDFYAKQARDWPADPRELLPPFPGLDGGILGHWGNQNEETWRDGRWNRMDCGPALCGVFREAGLTVAKAVCVRLSPNGERSACYDPETDEWRAVWEGGFVRFSDVRHGLMDGLLVEGRLLGEELGRLREVPKAPRRYRGYYRHGDRTIFSFDRNGAEELMAVTFADGSVRLEQGDTLLPFTKGGPARRWPRILETRGTTGGSAPGWPYVIDTLTLPFENPWNTLFFIGGHDFFSNGDIALCTMTGDVWRVSGVDSSLSRLRWQRMAAGLHQPLGLVIVEDKVHVLGRDQITRLHDLNGDGEADFYECLTNDFTTPTGGHDYLCGLERDTAGNFYTVSGKEGLLRLAPGKRAEVVASGFRNPDGLGLAPDGTLTVPVSEGDWTPASAVAQITSGGHYGYPGPRPGVETLPPLLYLPRGMDNSSGGQTWVPDDRWGPLRGQMIHLSYGTGSHFLVLRQEVNGVWQGAAVPMPGDFSAGAHRARFSPRDGQLYVSGMTGWGTYTPHDGCLQRVRFTGGPVPAPVAFEARDNGVLLTFSEEVHPSARAPAQHFAQCWNYRYGQSYGSQEYSLRHPETPGHDVLRIASAHIAGDGFQLFLEIPQLQPAGQIHLVVQAQPGVRVELFLTAHRLAPPFTAFPGYAVIAKSTASQVAAPVVPARLSPHTRGEPGRALRVEAAPGLRFATTELTASAGERLSLTFANPDVLPHNWVLLAPDSLGNVGRVVDKLIADPEGAARHYVPDMPEILAWTEMVPPGGKSTIHFNASATPGKYPFICTFPGHWMVMKGVLNVE